ncbi:MAG: transcription initiation factor IIF, beta subunit-domain-containing protein [Linnemannia elongata]|nr:MAG: transcription initiation factor IIF, beta subunit-domain-containing protein [Linnemannia elongata]
MSDTERNSRKRPADFEELFDDGEETKEAVESEDEMVDEDGNVVGDLDLTKAETQAWLVKIPKFLADRWSTINEEGVNLGKVRIFNQTNPNDPNAAPFQLILPDDDHTQSLPKTYRLNMNPNTVNNTFVFTEPTGPHPKPPHAPGYPTGKATSILATIKHECAVTPNPGSPEYREIMRERTLEANKKGGRHVQILGDNNKGADGAGGRGGMFLPGMGVRNGFIQKKVKVQMDQKTTRMPKNELMDLLFTAFEQYPYWSFKGLVEYVKQPQTYLKDVLAEICNFIKKGPYTAKYQLKPEFAGGAGRSSGGSSSSSSRPASGVVNAELETTFNPAAVGVGSGETATQAEAAVQEEVDDDDEDFDETDEEMVEVE